MSENPSKCIHVCEVNLGAVSGQHVESPPLAREMVYSEA